MKSIDIKSLIIGALLTSTIFLGIAATGPKDAWDANQVWEWETGTKVKEGEPGWIPCGMAAERTARPMYMRRIK